MWRIKIYCSIQDTSSRSERHPYHPNPATNYSIVHVRRQNLRKSVPPYLNRDYTLQDSSHVCCLNRWWRTSLTICRPLLPNGGERLKQIPLKLRPIRFPAVLDYFWTNWKKNVPIPLDTNFGQTFEFVWQLAKRILEDKLKRPFSTPFVSALQRSPYCPLENLLQWWL